MSDADDIRDAVIENAKGPKKASDDSTSMEQHPLPDQIEAAKFTSGNAAAAKGGGIVRRRIVPGSDW